MKKLVYLLILVLCTLNYSETCDLIKFKHKSGKPDFYEKLKGKTCNGEPIFKMLGDVFFIYKTPGSQFWCEAYTPSKLVICDAECDEIRFDMTDLYSTAGVRPEEYNGHFDEWIELSDNVITCNDHNVLNDVFVHDSAVNIKEITEIQKELENEKEVKHQEKDQHEKKLDELMEKIKEIQSSGSDVQIVTTTPSDSNASADTMIEVDLKILEDDKYILSMVNSLPAFEQERMSKIQKTLGNDLENPAAPMETGSRLILPTTSTSAPVTNNPSVHKADRLAEFLAKFHANTNIFPIKASAKNSPKKQDILKNRDNSCTRISLEILDESVRESSMFFDLVPDVNCLNYPVYKSQPEKGAPTELWSMYLYRNVYGEWCQKNELESFKPSTECFRKCNTILLGPGMIKSPIETTLVTFFDLNNQVNAKFTNHRYVCKTFSTCESVTCQNGGECVKSDEKTRRSFTCKCPYYSTGRYCEEIIDTCHSSPCLNGGVCSAKPFQRPTCECAEGFTGALCENEIVRFECAYNPCLNGGRCVEQMSETEFVCECAAEYQGSFCEVPALDSCQGKFFGENIPHPTNSKQFLVCLQSGRYQISPCPRGLVFNRHLHRCDYSTEKEETIPNETVCQKLKPCLNGGKCFPALNSTTDFFCECKLGFTGLGCEQNIDDCARTAECGEGNKCVDLINSFVCVCENDRFYGPDCGEKKVEIPCSNSSTDITRYSYPYDNSVIVECDNNGRLTLKMCPSSLVWSPSLAACTYPSSVGTARMGGLVDLKCLEIDCQNGASCVVDDKLQEAKCICRPGFEGELCEVNVDECASSPCLNNGKCVDGVNEYFCVCENKFIDKDCCCVNSNNPCTNVLNEFQSKKDKTVRYPHPFTMEKFIVCNLEGFAQVLDCPEGLVWKQDEETCALKNNYIGGVYKKFCTDSRDHFKLTYPYSSLKYAVCAKDGYNLHACPKESPYFCAKNSKCVGSLANECKNSKRY